MMKVMISCLLGAALLSVTSATSENVTQCYFCYNPTEFQYCNEIKTCRDSFDYCRTVTLSQQTGFPFIIEQLVVTRDCVKSCENSDLEDLGSETEVYCCKGNLCNSRYEFIYNLTNTGAPTFQPRSGVYGGAVLSFSLFSLLFPSWI
ncbi:secreted Ly-6/uPAR-related protein 1-like [Mantella aurantiaca]